MKETIARETVKLLFEKRVKKLTVKDIVAACNITRQAFYYHFSDIPELFQWILQQGKEEVLKRIPQSGDIETQIRQLLLLAVNARPVIKQGLESNYGEELEHLLFRNMEDIFLSAMKKRSLVQGADDFAQEFMIRYHCQAVIGLLRGWSEEDTKNLDQIAHIISGLISQRISS